MDILSKLEYEFFKQYFFHIFFYLYIIFVFMFPKEFCPQFIGKMIDGLAWMSDVRMEESRQRIINIFEVN